MEKRVPHPTATHKPGAKPSKTVAVAHTKPAPPVQPLPPAAWVWLGGMIAFAVLCNVAVGKQGQRKGQSFWFGFALSLCTSPIVASIFIAFMRPTYLSEEGEAANAWWRVMLVLTYLSPLIYVLSFILLIVFWIHVTIPGFFKFFH